MATTEQLEQVVGCANQSPFTLCCLKAAPHKGATITHSFDLTKYRLNRLATQFIQSAPTFR